MVDPLVVVVAKDEVDSVDMAGPGEQHALAGHVLDIAEAGRLADIGIRKPLGAVHRRVLLEAGIIEVEDRVD